MEYEKLENTMIAGLPFWQKLSDDEKQMMINHVGERHYAKGETVHDGSDCTGAVVVKSGCLRVYILSEEGREITLYRMYSGDICMLTASCVLQSITFDVTVDAEEETDCCFIASSVLNEISQRNKDMKIYMLETALSRFSDVMWAMEQILFMSFDKRLAIFLYDEITKSQDDTVRLTHEQIARYMGSAREVVSRMLKYFAGEHMVELSRGGVRVIDKKKLYEMTK